MPLLKLNQRFPLSLLNFILVLILLLLSGCGRKSDLSAGQSPLQDGGSADANMSKVAAGARHSCVVRGDESIWCWGDSTSGQLGDGTLVDKSVPALAGFLFEMGSSNNVLIFNDGADRTATLTAGNFTGNQLAAEIKLQLESVNGNADTYTVSYDSTNRKFTITNVQDAGQPANTNAIVFLFENGGTTAEGILGFSASDHNDIAVGDSTTSDNVTSGTLATNFSALDTGDLHTCAVGTDGTLWCWGENADGQIGDGTTTDRVAPVQIGVATDWLKVSIGGFHTCAIKTTGTLWCWGDNFSGQLGDGTTTDSTSPVQVAGTTWLYVTTGDAHTCAIRTDGTLWCWGENLDGQVGLVPATDQQLPLQVGADTDWAAVSAGGSHTCAIKTDKSLSCWGDNLFGQLGDRFRIDRSSPFAIGINPVPPPSPDTDPIQPPPTPDTDWRSVSAGASHSCAMKESGTLWCWGSNDKGRLGNGVKTDTLLPIQVGTNTDWVGISSGNTHTCGTKTDGAVLCWGDNLNGRLGLGTTASKTAPAQIGSDANWASLSAGNEAVCAIRTDGTLYCWGENGSGQLGDGSTDRHTTPTQIGTATNWESVSFGDIHTCGLKTDDTIHCWGDNYVGQLGYETTSLNCPTNDPDADGIDSKCPNDSSDPPKSDPDSRVPNQVVASADWADISAASGFTEGRGHTCALKTNGTLWCWGGNSGGQLGNGTSDASVIPLQIGSVNTWASVSAAGVHTCVVQANGANRTLWCWGINFTGHLGDGTTVNKLVPTVVDIFEIDNSNNKLIFNEGAADRTATLTAGAYAGIDLATEIKLQLESANVGPDTYTVTYDPTDKKFTITNNTGTGNTRSIDFLFENVGTTAVNILGFNTTNLSAVALGASITSDNAKVIEANWSVVETGDLHTCAVKVDGTLWCWGNNLSGQIGDSTTTNRLGPVQVGAATTWETVSVGGFHTCATRTDGSLWCWGDNDEGQLGDGTTTDRSSQTQIGTDTNWVSVSSGTLFSCAVKTTGTLWCWGNNSTGQVGDGAAWVESPTAVTFS